MHPDVLPQSRRRPDNSDGVEYHRRALAKNMEKQRIYAVCCRRFHFGACQIAIELANDHWTGFE